jgi:K+-sensing histidine kinase KdpD
VLHGYVAGFALIATTTCIAVAAAPILQAAAFVTVFPLAVIVVTARFGAGPAVATALAGVLVFDYVFVPPALAFAIPGMKDALLLVLMLTVGVVGGILAEHLRRQVLSAHRQAEAELRRNALLSALSHDLRTPLTVLVGASAALCEDRLDAGDRQRFSWMVAEEAQRLERFVRNLLQLTRLESGCVVVQEPHAIDEVIGAVLRRFEPQLAGYDVRTQVPAEIPFAAFDPVLIEHVVTNLVENVIHHAGSASVIEIGARQSDEGIVVEVADCGRGVPSGQEERVFERVGCSGAGGNPGGARLGLTICRAIVAAHGGRIWLENRRGGGAVVRFTLPARPPAAARAHALTWARS